MCDPVGRQQLIKEYQEADILFLHLNKPFVKDLWFSNWGGHIRKTGDPKWNNNGPK